MKILIAIHHFPPRFSGGAELRAFRTARALQLRGHRVKVVCIERIDAGAPGKASWQDDEYDGVAVRRLSFDLRRAANRFKWEYDNPWVEAALLELIGETAPDIFHLIGGYLLTASSLRAVAARGIPSVITLTDYWFLCPRIQMLRSDGTVSTLPIRAETCARCLGEEQRRYRLPAEVAPGLMRLYWKLQKSKIAQVQRRQQTLRAALNTAAAIISPSQFLRGLFVEAGVASDRIVFSRQGRDFPQLSSEQLEKKPSAVLRVGYIGQIAEIKGVHLLFEAVASLPQAPIAVTAYGDTTPFPEYTARLQQIAAADSRLKLAGTYQPGEVSAVMQNLDVIVVPSLWYENSPNVILEAFAHRTPVIAANLGGMAELVEHRKNGLHFQPASSPDLARQLQTLLDEPALLPALREAIPPVKSSTQEIDELETIYENINRRYQRHGTRR